MKSAQIIETDAYVRKNFVYRPDPDLADTWRSHVSELSSQRPWHGDCDDLTSTLLDQLSQLGVPLHDLFMLMVSTSFKIDHANHLVGAVLDDEGRFWIVGDTFRPAYRAESIQHIGIKYRRLNEWGVDGRPLLRLGYPWTY